MILLSRKTLASVAEWLSLGYPNEACGLLIGTAEHGVKTVNQVRCMANTEVRPNYSYIMDPAELLKVRQEMNGGKENILGIFHSHPNIDCRPSGIDINHAFPGFSYIIVAVDGGEIRRMQSWLLRHVRDMDHGDKKSWGKNGRQNSDNSRQLPVAYQRTRTIWYREFEEETLAVLA